MHIKTIQQNVEQFILKVRMIIKRKVQVFKYMYKSVPRWEVVIDSQATDWLLSAYTLPVESLFSLQSWGTLLLVQGIEY